MTMPDIAMCENETCKLKQECYRYMAKPNEHWQVYADFKPVREDYCENQIPYD